LVRPSWSCSSQRQHGDRLGDAQSDRGRILAEPVRLQLVDRLMGDKDGGWLQIPKLDWIVG
jgi:hypothetical protein